MQVSMYIPFFLNRIGLFSPDLHSYERLSIFSVTFCIQKKPYTWLLLKRVSPTVSPCVASNCNQCV